MLLLILNIIIVIIISIKPSIPKITNRLFHSSDTEVS